MLDSIDSLIQHLKGNKPYDQVGTKKLWDALKYLDTKLNANLNNFQSEDITSRVRCNVKLIQFGPDQGIFAIASGNVLVVSIHCSFRVEAVAVDYIDLELPYPGEKFINTTMITAPFAYQFLAVGVKLGTMYMGIQSPTSPSARSGAINHIFCYNNDYTQWPVSASNVYISGQLAMPIIA